MNNARRLVIYVSVTVLLAVPLIRSQDVQPLVARVIDTQPHAIEVLELQPQRPLDIWLPSNLDSVPGMGIPDLSRYRGFRFGETLPALAKQAGLDLSDVKLIRDRPAIIQELEWPIWLGAGSSPQTDPVKTILFSFYNGELFRIVVSYDQDETEGLTSGDIIDAISAKYGTASKLAPAKVTSPSSQVDYETETLIARWEDSQYSLNLYRSGDQATYGMTAFSKRVDALARNATVQANRLEAQEAPQREIKRQQLEDEKNREALEKARQVNKGNFRL